MGELLFLNLNFSNSRFLVLVPLRISFFSFSPSPHATHNPVCHVSDVCPRQPLPHHPPLATCMFL